jgi:diguanylate cyclase (GGDEF)-like protein
MNPAREKRETLPAALADRRTGPERLRCARKLGFHGVAGGIAGYAMLHPLSMLIHGYFHARAGLSLWTALGDSFSPGHLSMAVYFTVVGGVSGVVHGLYACRTARLYEEVKHLSVTDELTSLFNRRYLMRWLGEEINCARGHRVRLSLTMIDVDHFKRYNDTHGHQKGDALLRALAEHLKASARKTDLVARYGGEEFVVVMPGTLDSNPLLQAERLRASVEGRSFAGRESQPGGRLTISLGVAEFPADAKDVDGLVRAADAALYRAKAEGRNRVCASAFCERPHDGLRPVAAAVET